MDATMKNIGSDGICPHCQKKVPGYNPTKVAYGIPIQTCPKCGNDYYDRRFFEPAVSGFVMGEMDKKRPLKLGFAGLICFLICFGVNWLQIHETGEFYIYLAIMEFVSIIVIIAAIIDAIRISAGSKRKKLDFLMWQSDERLKNTEYAVFLKEKGLNVPEKYLPASDVSQTVMPEKE